MNHPLSLRAPCGRLVLMWICAVLLSRADWASGIELVRGPYLQAGTTNSMIVRWRTSTPSNSRVVFGPAPDALVQTAFDSALVTNHVVTLTSLVPNTRHCYGVGSSDTILASGSDFSFVTPPMQAKPTRIWVLGDPGTARVHEQNMPGYEGLAAAVRDSYYTYAANRDTDVWLMLGDDAYLSATDDQFQTELFDIYPATLRRTPLWSCLGNHDYNPVAGFPYLQVFSFPTNGEAGGVPSGSELYYSFDYGNIHFVCLDSEVSDRSTTGPMLDWLARDLAAHTRDWLIAFWHSPPYSKGGHDSDGYDLSNQMPEMRSRALPLLEAHGLDLMLAAHSHSYERSYLLDGHYGHSSTLVPEMLKDGGTGRPGETGPYRKPSTGPAPHEGAVYVVPGSSGWVTPYGNLDHRAMLLGKFVLGSLVIDVNSNRMDVVFLRETGAIDDHFTLLKGAGPEPLRLCTFQIGNGRMIARWKSVAGQSYQVERSGALDPLAWLPVSPTIPATGATTSWTNTAPAAENAGFYRVVTVMKSP
jgi:acid phosphatase type 7